MLVSYLEAKEIFNSVWEDMVVLTLSVAAMVTSVLYGFSQDLQIRDVVLQFHASRVYMTKGS